MDDKWKGNYENLRFPCTQLETLMRIIAKLSRIQFPIYRSCMLNLLEKQSSKISGVRSASEERYFGT